MKKNPRLFAPVILFTILSLNFIAGKSGHDVPKNMILLISDGCGFNTVDAASYYQYGATGKQVYEQFPVRLAMSTHLIDQPPYNPAAAWSDFDYVKIKPTDSAASGTAIATGVKTKYTRLGVDSAGTPVKNITECAELYGKATGVVTSVPFNNATPAVFIAHNELRYNYEQIAKDMLAASAVDVIMACGDARFDDDGKPVDDPDFIAAGGAELWRGLAAGTVGADADNDGQPDPWTLIQEREQFRQMKSGPTPKRVLGIVKTGGTLQQVRGGDPMADPYVVPLNENVPTLAEMTSAALNVLDNDPDGFFLMIEGGAIDWAAHKNQAGRTIEEQIDFNHSVEAVVAWVETHSNWEETLVIITADHETGYITGPGSNPDSATPDTPIDSIWKPLVNNGAGQVPGLEWHSRHHTNSLVPFYAKGSGSDVFIKRADQTDPVYGQFLDNADIGQVLIDFCGGK